MSEPSNNDREERDLRHWLGAWKVEAPDDFSDRMLAGLHDQAQQPPQNHAWLNSKSSWFLTAAALLIIGVGFGIGLLSGDRLNEPAHGHGRPAYGFLYFTAKPPFP